MSVINRTLKSPKRKAAIAKLVKTNPDIMKLPAGLDPTYWTRHLSCLNVSTGDRYSLETYVIQHKTKPKSTEWWRLLCNICGARGETEGAVPPCLCVRHIPCGSSHKAVALGKTLCREQHHCGACCSCRKCSACSIVVKAQHVPRHTQNILGRRATGLSDKVWCKFCIKCNSCCKCVECVNCGTKTTTPCVGDARRPHHPDCCDCDEMLARRVLMLKRQPVFHEGTNFQHNRIRRMLSVESEIDHYTYNSEPNRVLILNQHTRKWRSSVVPDGTIPSGAEICTAPASGDAFTRQIRELHSAYRQVGAELSIRCGMHVHVDARDFSYHHLINLLHLYAKLEPALFAMCPPQRRISRFSVPCRDKLLAIASNGGRLVEAVRDVEMASLVPGLKPSYSCKPSIALRMADRLYGQPSLRKPKLTHKSADNQHIRYMALNLHSWVYRRTIEFRHWPGSLDLEEMLLWPQVLGALMEYAKRTPMTAIQALPGDPVQALLEVVKARTWVSKGLTAFVERMLRMWSPDWSATWPIINGVEGSQVVPFRLSDPAGFQLSFDTFNKVYTYLPPQAMTWDHQWNEPYRVRGRYATKADLLSMATSKVAWIAPEALLQQPNANDARPAPSPVAGVDFDALMRARAANRRNPGRFQDVAPSPPPRPAGALRPPEPNWGALAVEYVVQNNAAYVVRPPAINLEAEREYDRQQQAAAAREVRMRPLNIRLEIEPAHAEQLPGPYDDEGLEDMEPELDIEE